ncbi:hypothetical protein COR52_25655 [Vibrio mediterranei]|uniref:Toxin co-regulated pilus biosynthesis protein Q C-terminal domain-containing protein n=2 Tax=Vibrio mediterranei TaxID=689 RepID=A0ABX5DAA3_9VIBR|nr:hypothetical protein COR52_25655 [Vibrio mediterranei]PRQ66610.1 hypothetical protein COR51_16310 [Vibrio mediterranei]
MKTLLLSTLIIMSASSTTSIAAPKSKNVDTLSDTVRTIVWPTDATTIKDAIVWITEPLGYTLITEYPAPPSAADMLAKPIPESAKPKRVMRVMDAIQLLIGTENTIIVDNTHRLITVQRGH